MKNSIKKKPHNIGFSLVEMLVVLVILAILAAVAIPGLVGYIKKAKERLCESNRAELIHQVEMHILSGDTRGIEELFMDTMAECKIACPDHGTYEVKLNSEGGYSVTCSKHGTYKYSFSDPEVRDKIMDIMGHISVKDSYNMDSGGVTVAGSMSEKLIQQMEEEGIDLTKMGAVSWQYTKKQDSSFFYWSTLNIASIPTGSKIPVMRYNTVTGTYTVWITTLKENANLGTPYNTFGSYAGYAPSTANQTSTEQTYDNCLEHYKNALKQYGLGA